MNYNFRVQLYQHDSGAQHPTSQRVTGGSPVQDSPSIGNASFGDGSPTGVWDLNSPDLDTELTVPSFRRPIDNYPSSVRHHVQLSDPPSRHLNPLNYNGFPSPPSSTLDQHDLLNRHPRTTSVSIPNHGPHQYNNTINFSTDLQYLSNQQLDTIVSPLPAEPQLDFINIRSDYLNMINKSSDNQAGDRRSPAQASSSTLSPLTPLLDDDMAAQAVMDVLEGSPQFNMENDFSSYLTSPLDDSPWEDNMLTPPGFGAAGDMGVDILTSPALIDSCETFNGLPLFTDAPLFDLTFDKLNAHNAAQPLFDPALESMAVSVSPNSSSLDPVSLRSSPQSRPVSTSARSVSKTRSSAAPSSTKGRRKSTPTGTRKNVTPDSLIPVSAPIQTRNYVAPSATSRKELPAVFARKRKRSLAFEAEEDEETAVAAAIDPSAAPPTQTELDAIEAKRRQNTLAARRSRKRKLEHQKELESAVDAERQEKEAWRMRAMALEALCQSHGVKIPAELEEGLR